MGSLNKQDRSALETVARRFSATWEKASDSTGNLKVAGKRIAVDIRTLNRRGTGHRHAHKPRLRFDKVVTRLLERLRVTFCKIVPGDVTVLVTITAPIRLASKTASVLEDKIQALLGRSSLGHDEKDTIHGNRVQIRLLRKGSERTPKVIGFVHNSDADPLLLLNMTSELLEVVGAESGRRGRKLAGNRWLVLINGEGISCLEVYRFLCTQLRAASGFKKILMVFESGRVEVLAE